MKKLIVIALTLVMLCGAVAVSADTEMAAPSKTTDDFANFDVTVENPVDGKVVAIVPVSDSAEEAVKYKDILAAAASELEKAQAAGSVEAYFGGDTAKAITDILGANAEISLDEFLAVYATGYEEGMGSATVAVQVATPYEKDEKVAAMIGLLDNNNVTWNVFEGAGLEDGRVQFTVPANVMLALTNGSGLFAICSK